MIRKHVRCYKLGIVFFFIALLASLIESFQLQHNLKNSMNILQLLNLTFSTSLLTHLSSFISASQLSTFTLHHAASLITCSVLESEMNIVQSWPGFINLGELALQSRSVRKHCTPLLLDSTVVLALNIK